VGDVTHLSQQESAALELHRVNTLAASALDLAQRAVELLNQEESKYGVAHQHAVCARTILMAAVAVLGRL